MKKYLEVLKEKHLPVANLISESTYLKRQKELTAPEFEERFFVVKNGDENDYYEIASEPPDNDSQLTMHLLDKLLAVQERSEKKLSTISAIIVFWLVCQIIAAVFIAFKLLA